MRNILLVALMTCSTAAFGQFNSKVGYSAWLHNMNNVDALIEDFNGERAWLSADLNSFNFTSALELGVKYRVNRLTFEFGVTSGQAESRGVGINPDTQLKEEPRWKFSHFDYHVNVIQHFGGWGIGAGIVNQRLKFREFSSISNEFQDITKETNFAGKLFIQMEVPSRTISICLRPFYQFSLDDYDISPVADALSVDGTGTQGLKVIGLSLLLFNGPQS